MRVIMKSPGLGTRLSWPMNSQQRAKICSSSCWKMSGFTYSSRLRVPFSVSMNDLSDRSPREVLIMTKVILLHVPAPGRLIGVEADDAVPQLAARLLQDRRHGHLITPSSTTPRLVAPSPRPGSDSRPRLP